MIIPILGAIGLGSMPSKEELADRWISQYVPNPADYTGTLATTSSDITTWANECGDYIHTRNPLYNRANSRSICQSKIENLYQGNLLDLKQQEYNDSQSLKATGSNTTLYMVVALVVIVMIIIVLILKM